jgi:hypothetical protein
MILPCRRAAGARRTGHAAAFVLKPAAAAADIAARSEFHKKKRGVCFRLSKCY